MAYPFGRRDDRVVRAVRQAGFETALTVPDNLSSRDPLEWPRIGIYRGDGLLSFEAKVSRVLRNLRNHAAGKSLVRLVRAVRGGAHPHAKRVRG
jgi:hypothetical protein